MTVNYHTHTVRCRHADGDEREYVETAIARGLSAIGFSDHCPMPFPNEHRSGHRMDVAEFPDYVADLLALREEYRDRIQIHIGLEVEYYPLVFPDLIRLIAPYPVDYLILGQHFLGNEFDERTPCSVTTDDENRLAAYVAQVTEALKTGAFTYLAHPDVIHYTGDDATYRRHMLPLIRFAKEQGIPLEFNLLGLHTNRHYPSDRFFSLVAEEKAPVIVASDAHAPRHVANPYDLTEAAARLSVLGITPIERVTLRAVPKAL